MKQYTGTKTIKAMPMAKSEAEQKLNRTIDCKESEGYFIQYPDGYQSWSPKSVFEETYMPSETRLDRMRIEFAQVRDNFLKATAFMLTEDFRALPQKSMDRLVNQSNAMSGYLATLAQRIDDAKEEMRSKEAQDAQLAQKNETDSIIGTTIIDAGRCNEGENEPDMPGCKKLMLADGSHVWVKPILPNVVSRSLSTQGE